VEQRGHPHSFNPEPAATANVRTGTVHQLSSANTRLNVPTAGWTMSSVVLIFLFSGSAGW
jgi:hypothetical protein